MEACLMKWAVPMPWQAGVTFIEGRGKLIDAHTVDVDGKRYTVRPFRPARMEQGARRWTGHYENTQFPPWQSSETVLCAGFRV